MAGAQFMVTVDWERISGKFAGRDEIVEMIQEQLDEAVANLELSGLGADSDSEYEVTDCGVDDVTPPSRQPKGKRRVTPEERAVQLADEVKQLTTERNQLRNQLAALESRELRI